MDKRQQIREARKALGWTVERLAVEAGVSAGTARRVEAGKDCSVSTLEQLGRALGLRLDFVAEST